MRFASVMAFAGAILVSLPAWAENNNPAQNGASFEIGTGVDYSVGKYGATSDTSVFSIPLDLKFQFERFRLQAEIPYVDVKGPGTFAGGVIVGGGGAVTTRTGLGDTTVGGAYLLNADSTSFPAIELGASVKIPTASSNLGTGKVDYTAMANLYHSLTPRFMLFGTVGYQWLSDFGTINLENGVMASAGMNYKPSDNTSIGIAANYRQEYFKGLGDQFSTTPYVMWNFARNWRFVGYGTAGFTKASPRFGAGMRLVFFE